MHVIQMIVSDRHTKCSDRHAKKLELRDRQTPDGYPVAELSCSTVATMHGTSLSHV